MSHESGNSSGVSTGRARGRVVGVPKRCWCGELVIPLMSNSKPNPCRRYFRCAFAAEKRLSNDNHSYKWVDEALLDEVEALSFRIGRLEQGMLTGRVEEERDAQEEKTKFEEFGLKLETEISARMEDVVNEVKSEVKKALVLVVLGCVGMVVLAKIL
ncbi:uncharacterized protein At4g04775-like [Raphanus sativus]|uniref:Uncharacterized protein At4g04775-like n=1 Tax=Raphanus sativus TaxID=3726 RepID=A0A9W3BRC4_RAPSA|nr:uncharacterized protein At4g04775-like [Raphanus sativus]XP_056842801.1 uncharacterized protein At4g04775-like [Raphanus sativus]XP_056845839.1 uncharacterized protein At4g04775-like [Raphanus sativus]XP_056856223.1 uncharacterized protein At4g04775-like [Raphanus sativus]XP_056857564.1 uncharacterized protein At4g04775-like [Raphanus sativus]